MEPAPPCRHARTLLIADLDADKGGQTAGPSSPTVADGDTGDVEQASAAGDDSSDVAGVEKMPVTEGTAAVAQEAADAAAIPMLQVAVSLVRECLWKDQVRIKSKDERRTCFFPFSFSCGGSGMGVRALHAT